MTGSPAGASNQGRTWSVARRVVGAAALLAGLAIYRSDQNRSVLGRWSPTFAVAVLAIGLALALFIALALRRGGKAPVSRFARRARTYLETAFLVWAAGYFAESVAMPEQSGALLDGNLFGGLTPVGALLTWLALLLAFTATVSSRSLVPRRAWNPALLAASVVAVALAGEGVARTLAFVSPRAEGFPTYRSVLWGRRFVRLNRDGFRDAEQDPGTARSDALLAVIGDSVAFGWGIPHVRDRVGELLAVRLREATGQGWRSINASLPDQDTLQEFRFMDYVLRARPDVVILLYVFNDIDYLRPVTTDKTVTDPTSILSRLDPVRLLFLNSFVFQGAYVRIRRLLYIASARSRADELYRDAGLLQRHLADLDRLLAKAKGIARVVLLVPVDFAAATRPSVRERYDRFVCEAARFRLPVVSVRDAFEGQSIPALSVNELDSHPNELANRLLADKLTTVVRGHWRALGVDAAARGPHSPTTDQSPARCGA